MKIKIIYATQTGTTQYVAEIMQQKLAGLGHQVDLHSVRYDGSTPTLEGYDAILFGAPTYEDGKLETAMRVFIARFNVDLSGYRVGIFGLGNSTYPQFCVSATILADWAVKNKAVLTSPVLRIDGFPDDVSSIETWIEQFSSK